MRHFYADDANLAAAGRALDVVVRGVESFLASAMPILSALADRLDSLSREPETPGHEKLFREQLGYDPLRAKFTTRAIHHLGNVLADEINQGRRVRAIIDEMAKTKDCSTLELAAFGFTHSLRS
jgi:hypothetical protein